MKTLLRLLRPRIVPLALALALSGAILHPPRSAATAGSPLYPNLKTLPPQQINLARVNIGGSSHYVLRFSNTVRNDGEGPLELVGQTSDDCTPPNPSPCTKAYQRFYDSQGQLVDPTGILVGEFVYHPTHEHWHFGNFALYEVWTRREFRRWEQSGGQTGASGWSATKVTFCIIDSVPPSSPSARSPSSPVYRARQGPGGYRSCSNELQGLSVGWADVYSYVLSEQWVDFGSERPKARRYVLRTIADPSNLLYESDGKAEASREAAADNEAVMKFRITEQGRVKPGWAKKKR